MLCEDTAPTQRSKVRKFIDQVEKRSVSISYHQVAENSSLSDDEALKDYIVNDNKDDDEDFMFSQTVINDMETHLDDNDDFQDYDEDQDPLARVNLATVKLELAIKDDSNSSVLSTLDQYS
uniref:Uncharacterized protein n=1 Tax=Glossina morsitans morsitans TaxID=37546 RepID=A0A1B0GBS1_GLOMM